MKRRLLHKPSTISAAKATSAAAVAAAAEVEQVRSFSQINKQWIVYAWDYFRRNSHAFISLSIWCGGATSAPTSTISRQTSSNGERNAIVLPSHFAGLDVIVSHSHFIPCRIDWVQQQSHCKLCGITSSYIICIQTKKVQCNIPFDGNWSMRVCVCVQHLWSSIHLKIC